MSEAKINETKFIRYEYIEVTIKRDLAPLCNDCYHALGWNLTETADKMDRITLRLQRDRKIKHRTALSELQRKCEDAFQSIERLERVKASKATIISLGVGLGAVCIMIGAVLAYMTNQLLLSIILAILALVGLSFLIILYQKHLKESSEKLNPMIVQYYNTIYDVCDKASQLLEA